MSEVTVKRLLLAHYPSGQTLKFQNVVIAIVQFGEPHGDIPVASQHENDFILDPRALITADGEITYNPRNNKRIATWAQEWLDDHPEWPPRTDMPAP